MEQQLFTIKEVCTILRVSWPTVYEMIRAGRIQRVYFFARQSSVRFPSFIVRARSA
jgi:excisionase family DNA binding protein